MFDLSIAVTTGLWLEERRCGLTGEDSTDRETDASSVTEPERLRRDDPEFTLEIGIFFRESVQQEDRDEIGRSCWLRCW